MRKVYLEELPHKKGLGTSKNKCNIDWNSSIGHKCLFFYDDINGEVEILEYDSKKERMFIKIEGYCESFDIAMANFKKCGFGVPLKKKSMHYKFELNQHILDEKRDLIIIDKELRNKTRKNNKLETQKWYKYKCNKCGYDKMWIEESQLTRKRGCSVCCVPTKFIIEGINDIPTTATWMVKYFQGGYDEAKKYTKCSAEKIYPICPDCGRISKKKTAVHNIYNKKTFGCSCKDGMSYPNKFIYNLLEQKKILFKTEKTFYWSKSRKYDFYCFDFKNKHNLIIEANGEQHYRYTGRGRTVQEEQDNDSLKEKLAKENGIKYYTIIDCRYSELDWIKNSIMNSELPRLLDFKEEDIDWLKCHEFALNNLVKEVCYYKRDNPEMTTTEIGNVFKVGKSVICRYLKIGNEFNWCIYNPKEESNKVNTKNAKLNSKKSSKKTEVFKEDKSLGVFDSCTEVSVKSEILFGTKLSQPSISAVCLGKLKSYKGYTFKYVD